MHLFHAALVSFAERWEIIMTNKKEEFMFVSRICIILFSIAIIGSMMYYQLNGKAEMPLLLIKQWIALDFFVFIGLLLGGTDIIVRIRSGIVRTLIVSGVGYLVGMFLLSKLMWNPFEDMIKFSGTTFLYVVVVFIFYQSYQIWKKSRSKAYMKMIEDFKVNHSSAES